MAHTIGLVIDQLVYEYHAEFWQGVSEQAVKSGINIVSYVGSTIDYADSMLRTQNKIYDIITEKRVEGAIILTSSVTSHISPDEKRAELRKISSRMPIVCIGDIFDEYPSIGVDNRKGMYDSVEHLIKKHNKRRIAFVGGPSGSTEAQERKAAYMEALTKNGITFDDALFFEGAFVYTSGIEAVQAFVSRKVQFDAVVAASDWMAFGAMQELKHQGFSIPEQIAVSGFDDVESAYVSQPPLSTVRQPVFEMGREAVKTILSIIDGRPYEKRLIYPTEHVIRDSCGCMLSVNVDEHVDQNGKSSNSRADAYHEQHKYLVQRLLKDMENPGSSGFLSMFNSFLERVKRPEELGIYQTLISEIRKEVLSYDRVIQHSGTVVRRKIGRAINTQAKVDKLLKKYCAFINSIEDTLHTARLLLSRKAEQLQFLKYLETKTKTSQIISVGEHLLTTFSKTHLFTTIKNDFPLIDIDTCSIVMYEDPEAQPVSPRSAMIYYYDNSSDRHKDTDPFDTDMIVPDAFWPDSSRSPWNLTILPINDEDRPSGYIAYESHNMFGLIYEAFSSEIASALRSIRIYRKSEEVATEIKERSEKINSLVEPMLESIIEVTSLSRNEIKTIETLSKTTETGIQKLEHSNSLIENTLASINQMLRMIEVIEDISSNINILALNASIESARAGTYGLGFQVIAEEIKGLSDSTATNTKNITEALKETIANIEQSSDASRENVTVFVQVKEHVDQVTQLLQNVTVKMNELSEASTKILEEYKQTV